jgi:hypothetical protein
MNLFALVIRCGNLVPGKKFTIAIFTLVWLSGLSHSSSGGAPYDSSIGKPEGVIDMSTLKISLQIAAPKIVIGESLWVEVVLENRGSNPVKVPDPEDGSPFEYNFRHLDTDPPHEFMVSAQMAEHQKTFDTVADEPIEQVVLNANEQAIYKEDLTPSILPGPTIGRYDITAIYKWDDGSIESEPVPVAITPAHVSVTADVVGQTDDKLISVFAIEKPKGQFSIFQRESDEGNPAEGINFKRLNGQISGSKVQVATAIELEDHPTGRWFAWLEKKGLGAGVAQDATLFALLAPKALNLESSELFPIGWQPSGEKAIFLVLGKKPTGKILLNSIEFEARGHSSVFTVALAAAKLPNLWAARLVGMEPGPTFDVVWAEQGPGRTWIFKQTICPQTGISGPVQALCEHSEALANISLYPLKGNVSDVVDLLFGPSGESTPYNFLRLPLSGGMPLLDLKLPLPPEGPAILPRQWALASKPLDIPAAVALFDNKLMVLIMGTQPRWRVLSGDIDNADHLSLQVIDEKILWATWADAKMGLQYQMIR